MTTGLQVLEGGFTGRPVGSVTGNLYEADAVSFDGTTPDYLTRGADLTGLSDGKEGLLSVWIDMTAGDGSFQYIINNSNATGTFWLGRQTDNTVRVQGRNAATTVILQMDSVATAAVATGWVHVLASWDLAATTGLLYINGSSSLEGGGTFTNDTIDYTLGDFAVGAETDGGNDLSADLADVFFHPSYLDISVEANREKFIKGGKPVWLGYNGERPLSTQPILFLAGPTDTWHTNRGSGGGFTENGALTDGGSSPSD